MKIFIAADCTAGSCGDYDFGVIAGSMHMARVICCKSNFMQRITYLAMFLRTSL